jgi:hypothetical protein
MRKIFSLVFLSRKKIFSRTGRPISIKLGNNLGREFKIIPLRAMSSSKGR